MNDSSFLRSKSLDFYSETKANKTRLEVRLVIKQQVGVGVDVLPLSGRSHFRVVTVVPLLVDFHKRSVVSSHSVSEMRDHSEQLVGIAGARQLQHWRVNYVVGQFHKPIVFVPEPLEVELDSGLITRRMLGETEMRSILSAQLCLQSSFSQRSSRVYLLL